LHLGGVLCRRGRGERREQEHDRERAHGNLQERSSWTREPAQSFDYCGEVGIGASPAIARTSRARSGASSITGGGGIASVWTGQRTTSVPSKAGTSIASNAPSRHVRSASGMSPSALASTTSRS